MENDQIIKLAILFAKEELSHDSSGHDWWHTWRVWNMAKKISRVEGGNLFIIELAALLHDVADYKINDGSDEKGLEKVSTWLSTQNIDKEIVEKVCYIIKWMGFRGGKTEAPERIIELDIVQDADQLDAIGAVGIARTFAYGGSKGRIIHDPDLRPVNYKSADEYKKRLNTDINHFYEKLLLLKDRMNTNTAKKIANSRHKFMKEFLTEFYVEWDGEV